MIRRHGETRMFKRMVFDGAAIAAALRRIEAGQSTGVDIEALCEREEISEATYRRWVKQYAHLIDAARETAPP